MMRCIDRPARRSWPMPRTCSVAPISCQGQGAAATEIAMLRRGPDPLHVLHLAPDASQTRGLLKAGVVANPYETGNGRARGLPLLAPMSEVAGPDGDPGRRSCAGRRRRAGRGVLLGGVPGVPPAKVVVLGGGVVGMNALRMALVSRRTSR